MNSNTKRNNSKLNTQKQKEKVKEKVFSSRESKLNKLLMRNKE